MKKFYPLALVLALSLSVGRAFAQEYPPPGIISTSGHGEVKVKPDSLGVSVMVEATSAKLADAREENSKKVQSIISAVKGLNIPGLTLETQNVQVYPMQTDNGKNLPKTIGYRVTNGLNIKVTKADPALVGKYASQIADASLKAGANHLNGMNFYLDDMSFARGKALQEAVRNAQQNASAMASAANLAITGVHSMEGTPQYSVMSRPYPMMMMKGGVANEAADTEMPVEPGEETVTSDVTVRFKF